MKTPSFVLALVAPGLMASPLATDQGTPTKLVTIPTATPSTGVYNWAEGWQTAVPIHPSCNSTLRAQLQGGLDDAMQLAQHARDHLLRFSGKSDIVKRYFGNGSLAEPIGWFDRVVAADKSAMTFRCDDPDGTCVKQPTWGGYHRGAKAPEETVICPLSFQMRRPLSSTCNLGYTVAGSPRTTTWAVDILHRLFHVPSISQNVVDHFAVGYDAILALAQKDPAKTARDSDALQYFAIDAWAYDIAAPGVGCLGKPQPKA